MKKITEIEFLDALKLCNDYINQVTAEVDGLFNHNESLSCKQFALKYYDSLPITIYGYLYRLNQTMLKDVKDTNILNLRNVSKIKFTKYKELKGF